VGRSTTHDGDAAGEPATASQSAVVPRANGLQGAAGLPARNALVAVGIGIPLLLVEMRFGFSFELPAYRFSVF
jgi:hypothetical protein